MKKFIRIESIECEPMDLATALENGLVTLPEGMTEEEINDAKAEPGYRTVRHIDDGTEEGANVESWIEETELHGQYPIELKDNNFAWALTEVTSPDYKARFQAEYQMTQNRYNHLKKVIDNLKVHADKNGTRYDDRLLCEHRLALRLLLLALVRRAVAEKIYVNVSGDMVEWVGKEDLDFFAKLKIVNQNAE